MGIPVLGICRGMQFINVVFGGRLNRSLGQSGIPNHVRVSHSLSVVSSTGKRIFRRDSFDVNSFHEQGVLLEHLAPDLEILAVSEDGQVVEAIHHKYRPIIGIQWHPERRGSDKGADIALLEYFKGLGSELVRSDQ